MNVQKNVEAEEVNAKVDPTEHVDWLELYLFSEVFDRNDGSLFKQRVEFLKTAESIVHANEVIFHIEGSELLFFDFCTDFLINSISFILVFFFDRIGNDISQMRVFRRIEVQSRWFHK